MEFLIDIYHRYFSWSPTHDGDEDGVAQVGGHTPANRLTETYTFVAKRIGHPCYGRLTPVICKVTKHAYPGLAY